MEGPYPPNPRPACSTFRPHSMLEDVYRGERTTPAIQRVTSQEAWCILDDGDETFPYPLHHLFDRLVGQQTVLAYRYIHLLYPFLSGSGGRGTDVLAFSPY